MGKHYIEDSKVFHTYDYVGVSLIFPIYCLLLC